LSGGRRFQAILRFEIEFAVVYSYQLSLPELARIFVSALMYYTINDLNSSSTANDEIVAITEMTLTLHQPLNQQIWVVP